MSSGVKSVREALEGASVFSFVSSVLRSDPESFFTEIQRAAAKMRSKNKNVADIDMVTADAVALIGSVLWFAVAADNKYAPKAHRGRQLLLLRLSRPYKDKLSSTMSKTIDKRQAWWAVRYKMAAAILSTAGMDHAVAYKIFNLARITRGANDV